MAIAAVRIGLNSLNHSIRLMRDPGLGAVTNAQAIGGASLTLSRVVNKSAFR
jgi:hypothetical protein